MPVHLVYAPHQAFNGPQGLADGFAVASSGHRVTITAVHSPADLPWVAIAKARLAQATAVVVAGVVDSDAAAAALTTVLVPAGLAAGVPILTELVPVTKAETFTTAPRMAARVRSVLENWGAAAGNAEVVVAPVTATAPAATSAAPPAPPAATTAASTTQEAQPAAAPAAAAAPSLTSPRPSTASGSAAGSAASSVPSTPASTSTRAAVAAMAGRHLDPSKREQAKQLLKTLKHHLEEFGARGIAGLGRKFRIMDNDGNKQLSLDEFLQAMRELRLPFTDLEYGLLFQLFDEDASGGISYDEFLVGVRGDLNERRKELVKLAFAVIDVDGNGTLDLSDITARYDASQHPDVISGKRTKNEVFREFLDVFDGGEKDGIVHPDEFERYYANVSASIDDDDYFELMIRNAWHISGGKGWCENTTCRRVLVTHSDGTQSVQEVKDDMAVGNDPAAIKAALKRQGVDVVSFSMYGGSGSEETPSKTPAAAAAAAGLGPNAATPAAGSADATPRRARGGRATQSSIVFG